MKNSKTVDGLIDAVQELLSGLADKKSPELKELSSRVEDAIAVAKKAVENVGESETRQLGRYVAAVDECITNFPRIAFATALLVGGVVAFFVSTASSRK